MTQNIQDTLLQLFETVCHDPESPPSVPLNGWQEGSPEWRLLEGFHSMVEQVQQRMLQFKRSEEQLREREEQYRSIFEATSDGLTINDLEDGHVVEANPAACQMYGYAYEEVIGLRSSVFAAPVSLTALDEVLETLKAGKNYQTAIAQSLRKDGTRFYTESHGTALTYRGKPHALGIFVTSPNRCRRSNCWNSAWRNARANSPRCWRSPTPWRPPCN